MDAYAILRRRSEVTLKELKAMARWGAAKWCDKYLPPDGDYREPELTTDTKQSPYGDYVMIMVFHNNKGCGEKE